MAWGSRKTRPVANSGNTASLFRREISTTQAGRLLGMPTGAPIQSLNRKRPSRYAPFKRNSCIYDVLLSYTQVEEEPDYLPIGNLVS